MLLSLHLKATMMKVSDPIMFGHAVERVLQGRVRRSTRRRSQKLGVEPEQRHRRPVRARSRRCRQTEQAAIEADIEAVYAKRPPLAMVDSSKGITNLHVPSDIIIDASMPAAIRASGQMWGPDGKLHDTKAMIPDRCYAGIYQEVDRRLQAATARSTSPTMGTVAERRPHGAEGRGVRLARQDVRDRRQRARSASSTPTARR